MPHKTHIIALLITLFSLMPIKSKGQSTFRVMEWNVENLFDTIHDEGKNDYDFMPEGNHHWTSSRCWRKLENISKVIMAASEKEPLPALIGLCEVENDSVMCYLTKRSPLRNASYSYVMTDSPDERGVDVAILYKNGQFRLLGHESKRVPSEENGFKPTRDILHIWGLARLGTSFDTVHAIVCHLPSRANGQRSSDKHRALAAQTLQGMVDSLFAVCPGCKLIVMGDFNADPTDVIFKKHIKVKPIEFPLEQNVLYTTMPTCKKELRKEQGTYRYQGLWSFIDHILVTENLLRIKGNTDENTDEMGILGKGLVRVINLDWLLEEDKTYGGFHPHRTYGGTYYKGGVSDHLPIIYSVSF